jgi:hypothetical protein
MMKDLKKKAKKHAIAVHGTSEGHAALMTMQAFTEGAKWQAKQDAEVAVREAQGHLRGGFFQLGTNIAKCIMISVDEDPRELERKEGV